MNKKYPFWWTSTITVYSKYVDPSTQVITWNRTVLKDCFWKNQSLDVYLNAQSSVANTPSVICRIPKNSKFLDAYTWNNTNNRNNKFSLKEGDIVIKGKVTDDIDEYTKGKRSSDIVQKYKDKGIIQISVFVNNAENDIYLPHYSIG